jgi:hypothetical protein
MTALFDQQCFSSTLPFVRYYLFGKEGEFELSIVEF